ncbi:MAG TPA: peptidoglycan editing factor PgeF [Thermoanaerobaculia bacterium]|nr:peptidoglycan editing factor PgeF [Thermoanaerobaculia bacterium]
MGLYYTTADFHGRLDTEGAALLSAILRERFGIDASLITCTQVHGTAVRQVNASPRQLPSTSPAPWHDCDTCDALWTEEPGVALGIKVADCLPVTIAEPARHILANIHSGWRGAARQITEVTLDAMEGESCFVASEAYAWLGPAIRVCCFEVGEEVVEQFRAGYAEADRYIDRSAEKPHLDLAGLTAARLRQRGFLADRIIDTGLCTRCDGSLFHSFRRDRGSGGRNLAIAGQ